MGKLIDNDHPVGTHYCDSGIKRFIDGDYAWAMQEGMLVAYVRGGCTINKDLAPVLASGRYHLQLGSPTPPTIIVGSCSSNSTEPLQATIHQRLFNWPHSRASACRDSYFSLVA